jgi:hypothetical protein
MRSVAEWYVKGPYLGFNERFVSGALQSSSMRVVSARMVELYIQYWMFDIWEQLGWLIWADVHLRCGHLKLLSLVNPLDLALLHMFVQIEVLVEGRTTYALISRRLDTLSLVSLHLCRCRCVMINDISQHGIFILTIYHCCHLSTLVRLFRGHLLLKRHRRG